MSEGGLYKPSEEQVNQTGFLEQIFTAFNGDNIQLTKYYIKQLMLLAKDIKLTDKLKRKYFKSRLYFRIKHSNEKKMRIQNKNIKKKMNKTVY